MEPVHLTIDEAIEAVTKAAWTEQPKPEDATCGHRGCEDHPGEGRKMIHCQSGFGMDMPLDSVIETIRQSRDRAWVDGWIGHDLAVLTAEGRQCNYDVKRPAELREVA